MIINKKYEIIIGSRNFSVYKKLGYTFNKVGDKIFVKIKHLSKGSHCLIDCKCKNCNKIINMMYKTYNLIINKKSFKGNYYCFDCNYIRLEEAFSDFSEEKFKEIVDKRNNNIFDKFGGSPIYCEEIRNKIQKTNLEKYGTEWQISSKSTRDKSKLTMLKRHGVEYPVQNLEIFNKTIETNLEKYETEWQISSKLTRDKSKLTMLKRHGVEYPIQNTIIFNKIQKASYSINIYKEIKYQGTYELDFLKFCEEYNLLNFITKSDYIDYIFEDKYKKYYPDFFLEKYNLIIEIKSDFIYFRELDKNLAKQKYCLEQGYNFIFIINKDYTEFLKIIKQENP